MNFLQLVRKAHGEFNTAWTATEHKVRRNAQRRFDRTNKAAALAWYALPVSERRIIKSCDGVFVNKLGYIDFE